jgi:hypothetical protein
LIYVIYQSVGWPPKGLDKSLLMNCQAKPKCVLTARQLKSGYVTRLSYPAIVPIL